MVYVTAIGRTITIVVRTKRRSERCDFLHSPETFAAVLRTLSKYSLPLEEFDCFAQAERDYFFQQEIQFNAALAVRQWNPRPLARFGPTSEPERNFFRVLRNLTVVSLVIFLIHALFRVGVNFFDLIGAIAFGSVVGRWLYPHILRLDNDRYPHGAELGRANASESVVSGLASLGGSVRGWSLRSQSPWRPPEFDVPQTLFTAIFIIFAVVVLAAIGFSVIDRISMTQVSECTRSIC